MCVFWVQKWECKGVVYEGTVYNASTVYIVEHWYYHYFVTYCTIPEPELCAPHIHLVSLPSCVGCVLVMFIVAYIGLHNYCSNHCSIVCPFCYCWAETRLLIVMFGHHMCTSVCLSCSCPMYIVHVCNIVYKLSHTCNYPLIKIVCWNDIHLCVHVCACWACCDG